MSEQLRSSTVQSAALRRLALVVAVLALIGIPDRPSAQTGFTVASAHPRVMLTPAEVTSLRSRALNTTPYRTVYTSMKSRVDGWSSPSTNRYIIGQQLQSIVMVALIENYNATYMTKVDTWIRNMFDTQGLVSLAASGDGGAVWGSGDIIIGMAWAFDWLYPALSPATRTQYGTYLRDFQDAIINEQGGMSRDGSRSDYSNQFYYFDGMFALTGLALYNEGVDNTRAQTYLNTYNTYLQQNMLPTVNQVGGANGGWHEGLGYVDRGMTAFVQSLEAWRTGTSLNYFPQSTGLPNLGKWVFYSTQPDGVVVNVGDVSGWPVPWSQDTGKRSALLAARYNDGFSQYMANRVSASTQWPYAPFYLLWYDSAVQEIAPASVGTDQYFDGIGWASMRSGWGASDVFALFTSGNYYFGHQHLDQNSFQIFRSSALATDNGTYNVGTPGYKTATRFHNTILIGDPGAASSTDDGAAGQTSANPQTILANPESSSSDKGDIVRYDSGSTYTYVVGDASKAYNSGRLTSYVRKFLYLKPDYFVVLDRIVLPNTTYPIRWMLQSDNSPTIAGRDVRMTNGSGQLQMRTLLPTDAGVSSQVVFSGTPEYGGGNARTEVVPGVRRTQETFLHVLRATDAQTTTMTDATLVRSASGALVGAQFGQTVALLAENTPPSGAETYTVTGSATLNHVIADLAPAVQYTITRNGAALTTAPTSANGVLRFTSPGGGTFALTSGSTISPPAPPTNVRIIR
jgi:hypothetical protein